MDIILLIGILSVETIIKALHNLMKWLNPD